MRKFSHLSIIALAMFIVTFSACKKELNSSASQDDFSSQSSSSQHSAKQVQELTFYALRDGKVLDKYSTSNPEIVINTTPISGLNGITILAIDFRPSNAKMYGIGSDDKIYVINEMTGAATPIPPLFTTSNNMPPANGSVPKLAVTVDGTQFGFDFNPSADRLRVISNTGQSLRINVETGFTAIDGSINPQPATITGAAYDNNVSVTGTGTELYVINVLNQELFEVFPANSGTLIEEGPLKLKVVGEGGFDIAPRNTNITTDIGLGLYEVNKKSTLFTVDVETGETTILAKYKKELMYSGIAISPM